MTVVNIVLSKYKTVLRPWLNGASYFLFVTNIVNQQDEMRVAGNRRRL